MRRNAKIMNVKSLAHFRVSDGSPILNHSSIKKKKALRNDGRVMFSGDNVELSGPWAKCLLSPGTLGRPRSWLHPQAPGLRMEANQSAQEELVGLYRTGQRTHTFKVT